MNGLVVLPKISIIPACKFREVCQTNLLLKVYNMAVKSL
jgi:hypothetical protein